MSSVAILLFVTRRHISRSREGKEEESFSVLHRSDQLAIDVRWGNKETITVPTILFRLQQQNYRHRRQEPQQRKRP